MPLDPAHAELSEVEYLGWFVVHKLVAPPNDLALLVDDVSFVVKQVSVGVHAVASRVA